MHFRFSWNVTITCAILAIWMCGMSYWQAQRHAAKIEYIKTLEARLKLPPEPITPYAESATTNWEDLTHRRLLITCTYDYAHEMILRNRRFEDKPGAFVITPCKIRDSSRAILVNRGFVSYSFMDRENRARLNRPIGATFTGLVKENMTRKMFSPSDPAAGDGHPWLDAWLRVNTAEMQKQIPYPIVPAYVEIIPDDAPLIVDEQLIETKSGRDEMFLLSAGSELKIPAREATLDPRYPIAVFDTVIPPGRHLGYIYEWAAMALMTVLAGVILQFKRARMVQDKAA